MIVCDNCGAVFKTACIVNERMDSDNPKSFQTYWGCPHCKSDQLTYAFKCDMCGEYVAHDYVRLADGTVACNNCYTLY